MVFTERPGYNSFRAIGFPVPSVFDQLMNLQENLHFGRYYDIIVYLVGLYIMYQALVDIVAMYVLVFIFPWKDLYDMNPWYFYTVELWRPITLHNMAVTLIDTFWVFYRYLFFGDGPFHHPNWYRDHQDNFLDRNIWRDG